jgi:hypothetical protein
MADISIEELADNVNNPLFGDDRLGVLFYNKAVEDKDRSLAEGRRCFKNREFVKIMVPGDRLNIVERPVQVTGTLPTDDRMRFPKQYARFKNQEEQKANEGTPLSLWPTIPETLAKELEFINVFTVEQLATLADVHVAKIPGGAQWKNKATDFVTAMKDQAVVTKMQSERDNEIDTLKKAVADQAARIEELAKRKG